MTKFHYSFNANVITAYTDGQAIYAEPTASEPIFTREDFVGGDREARAAWKAAGLE